MTARMGELPVPVAQAGKIFEGWLPDAWWFPAEDTVKITENTPLTATSGTDKREIAVLPDAEQGIFEQTRGSSSSSTQLKALCPSA